MKSNKQLLNYRFYIVDKTYGGADYIFVHPLSEKLIYGNTRACRSQMQGSGTIDVGLKTRKQFNTLKEQFVARGYVLTDNTKVDNGELAELLKGVERCTQ